LCFFFNFSFENSLCSDYVTEKLFKVLEYDVIPIVLGAGDYSKMAPPHSYIDVQGFESPEKLADYLKYLDKNETAYAEYFEWKSYFTVNFKNEMFCELCKALNNENTPPKVYTDISRWWFSESNCTLKGNFPWSKM
jgi:hypothetical protein